MAEASWNWKAKDGAGGGLLYESGNWGDLLKMIWLPAIVEWKREAEIPVNYLDPFAGDVSYPLGRKLSFRFEQAAMSCLQFMREPFISKSVWPSSAGAVARMLGPGRVTVFDIDAGRRERWARTPGIAVAAGESGWDVLSGATPGANDLWLVDPYDFLAEWRAALPVIVEKSRLTTIVVYIYNRAAKSREAFREYRAFRNAVDDALGDAPRRVGRVAADVFLPRAHHELLFLPGPFDRRRPDFDRLLSTLGERVAALAEAMRRAEAYEC